MSDIREQVINGEVTEDALLDAYKQLSDDSQLLLSSIQGAQWQTEYYKKRWRADGRYD